MNEREKGDANAERERERRDGKSGRKRYYSRRIACTNISIHVFSVLFREERKGPAASFKKGSLKFKSSEYA